MNIVLVHGVLGFHRKFGIDYFRAVEAHFQQQGIRVLAPALAPTGGVELRGNQLRDQILEGFRAGALDAAQPTHLIAHSMGGLDSRFLLSPANPGAISLPIRSLTTISTPHFGSPVADVMDEIVEKLPLEGPLNKLGISLDCLRDLTTSRCAGFSQKYIDRPGVAYFSVAGSGRPGLLKTCAIVLPLFELIRLKTGDSSDGLVPVNSAKWGSFDPQTWPFDHPEEIGYNLDHLDAPPVHLPWYDGILRKLRAL